MLAVSIIVPCRNEGTHIRGFLDSLLKQNMDGFDWEVIIADGHSNDGTREALEEYRRLHPRTRWIDNPQQIVSTGLNAAIRQARGEVVLRMDTHTEYAPDYVRNCVETLQSTGADNVGGPARTRAEGVVAMAIAASYHSPFSCGGARFHDDTYEGYVDTVTYGCWRKDTLLRLGLFDEALVRNQDDELNLRIVRSGGRIWQSPKIVSWYTPRASLRKLFRQYFQYGFWKIPVIRKHRLPASWRHLVPGIFVALVAGLPVASCVLWAAGWNVLAASLGLLWLAVVIAYAGATLLASITAARRAGWKLLPLLPVVFATYHVAYGSGFLWGLAYWARRKPGTSAPDLFTQLSR